MLTRARPLLRHAASAHRPYYNLATSVGRQMEREPGEEERGPRREPRVADLRSDTVTKPTAEMLCAMLDAPVGDDVYGDDPTVNRLQREAAELLGKEAALFVPSGTMSNLLAVAAQCGRGEEVILGDEQHLICYEQSGASALFGVAFNTLPQEEDGTFQLRAAAGGAGGLRGARSLEYAIAKRHGGLDAHYSRPALVAIENTHNRCGGAVLPQAWVDECAAIAHAAGLRVHMDGARLFNAAAAAGTPVARIVRDCDSVSICLSKGLGAPVGSVLVGDQPTIDRARRLRKALGGGMRQAGVLAAAGLVALREMPKRLPGDHARARSLARGLAAIPGVLVDPARVATNIIFFDLAPACATGAYLARAAADAGLAPRPDAVGVAPETTPAAAFCRIIEGLTRAKMNPYAGHRLRVVLHHQVTDEDVEALLAGAAAAAALLQ